MKRILLFLVICTLAFSLLPLSFASAKDPWYGLHSNQTGQSVRSIIGHAGKNHSVVPD